MLALGREEEMGREHKVGVQTEFLTGWWSPESGLNAMTTPHPADAGLTGSAAPHVGLPACQHLCKQLLHLKFLTQVLNSVSHSGSDGCKV